MLSRAAYRGEEDNVRMLPPSRRAGGKKSLPKLVFQRVVVQYDFFSRAFNVLEARE
mgnify:CR=1 FL=1|jgi:hypothetical protein